MIEIDQASISTNPAASNPTSCATPKITYLGGDHVGTPRRATDATMNQIVWSWDSAPFGETPAQTDPRNTGTKTNITLRFPGQQYDSDTNLHYNQQRDYNPSTGRYVQADPVGLAGGMNAYGYVANKPLSSTDTRGLSCTSPTTSVGTLGVGGSFFIGVFGVNGSVNAAYGEGQKCVTTTVCGRAGLGIYLGGGVSGALGAVKGSTSGLGGFSVGVGFDAGSGPSVGGNVSVGIDDNGKVCGLTGGKGLVGPGMGINGGVELCYTWTACTPC